MADGKESKYKGNKILLRIRPVGQLRVLCFAYKCFNLPPSSSFFFLLFWTGKLTEMLAKPFAMDRSCPEYWPGHSVSKGPLAQCCTGTGGSGTWRYTQAPLECFGSWFGSSSSCKLAKECEMSQWVNCWLIWLAFGQEPDRLNISATQKYLDINLWYSTCLWDFNMLQCH